MDNREALAWLCEALPVARERAAGTDAEDALAALLAEARAGQDVAGQADALRRRLRLPRTGTSRAGDGGIVGIPGLADGHPVAEIHGCPHGKCARTWVRQPGVRSPECGLHGGRLQRAGLS